MFKEPLTTKQHRILLIGLLTLLAAFLRFYNLDERSFWYDEVSSVIEVQGLIGQGPASNLDIVTLLNLGRVPPLYFVIESVIAFSDQTEWSMRLAPAIFGVLAVPLIYVLGVRLFNSQTVGIIAALLLTFSPKAIYYSQEARPYSLYLFFSLAAFYFGYLALQNNRWSYYIGYIVAATLSIYTFHYAWLLPGILSLYFLLTWKIHCNQLQRWITSQVFVGILSIPALLLILQLFLVGRSPFDTYYSLPYTIAGTWYTFTFGRVLVPSLANLWIILPGMMVFGISLVIAVVHLLKSRNRETLFFAAFILTWAILLILSLWFVVYNHTRVRYIIFFLPLYYLLVAFGISKMRPRLQKGGVVALLIVSLLSLYPYYFKWDEVGKGNFRTAAQYMHPNISDQDMFLYDSYTTETVFNYYLDNPQQTWHVKNQAEFQDIWEHNKNQIVWVVVESGKDSVQFAAEDSAANLESVALEALPTWASPFTENGYCITEHRSFPGRNSLYVYRYELCPG